MACNDCPQVPVEPRPPRIKTKVQFPTGFTGCRLRDLQGALPEEIENLEYLLPKITDDGGIVYSPETNKLPPPGINGYRRDPDDPWRFIPIWNECLMRLHGIRRNKQKGYINVFMICNHPQCDKNGKHLKCSDCNQCPYHLPPTE